MMRLAAVVVVLGLVCATPASSQSYDYANPLNSRHTISVQKKPALVAAGDRAVDATFCASYEQTLCVSSDILNFAIPIPFDPKRDSWDYGGFKYVLLGEERMMLLGRGVTVWVIESRQGVKVMRFAFSTAKGLVAFSGQLPDTVGTFVSVKPFGFGGK